MLSLALREREMMRTICLIATWSLVLTMMTCMLGDPFSYGPNRRHRVLSLCGGFSVCSLAIPICTFWVHAWFQLPFVPKCSCHVAVMLSWHTQQDSSDRFDFTVDLLSCYKVWKIKRSCVQGMNSTNDVGVDTFDFPCPRLGCFTCAARQSNALQILCYCHAQLFGSWCFTQTVHSYCHAVWAPEAMRRLDAQVYLYIYHTLTYH